MQNIKHSMICVTGVYLRYVANTIFVILHLNVSVLSICCSCLSVSFKRFFLFSFWSKLLVTQHVGGFRNVQWWWCLWAVYRRERSVGEGFVGYPFPSLTKKGATKACVLPPGLPEHKEIILIYFVLCLSSKRFCGWNKSKGIYLLLCDLKGEQYTIISCLLIVSVSWHWHFSQMWNQK